ncbi:DNA repair protein RadC [Sinimarinibacterium sp. NLF-5-8]|uniref:RadC family protein n=1 Tax=Sinimarinibacterium sp. NLF-5-8 TaxID=2698684 RepID=UPI00137BEC61|nr:DNA repair protein RadC [Sinimarinibacterium sp. NLF-5-8]QHS10665.1 JAB domain-containing protein [Sinimarinibacterium sp. NLF-5-8]
MAITDWPAHERPREKLLAQGASSLSDAELLAIFLRVGVPGMSAVDLARSLLARFGSLRALLSASQQEFCTAKGLGPAKFVQLQAVMEMARRHLSEQLTRGDVLSSPQLARDYVRAQLRHLEYEVFALLYLDYQHRVLGYEEISRGTLSSAAVYPREVVKAALKRNAAAVILAHNHPSGSAEPSQADRTLTERLQKALALVDIRVLDHLVVGEEAPVSFAERGWI